MPLLASSPHVVPESEHQDSVGVFGRIVRDTVYAFDAIWGIDPRDNTLAQKGKTPKGGYGQFLTTEDALKGTVFGLPWSSFWVYADDAQKRVLNKFLYTLQKAGAKIINETEILNSETIVSQHGWDWDWGSFRGYPNESEYTIVKVDFYNNIKSYLAELKNTKIHSLEDIVRYNYDNDGSEGGHPWPLGNPAIYSGQDGFLGSFEMKGTQDDTYFQALDFCQTFRTGIYYALSLGPSAQACYPIVTLPISTHEHTGMPYGLTIMQPAWVEDKLLKWASAIENLQRTMGKPLKQTLPEWYEYRIRNILVYND